MESLVFVTLAPLAVALMAAVGLVAWRRRAAAGGWGLLAFSVTGAGWLAFDALSVAAPTPEATVRLAQVAVAWCPLPGVAWFAFLFGYTGRLSRPARAAVAGLTAWSLVFGGLAVTNDAHRLVWATWTTVPDGPFLGVAYTLGPLAWVQTAFMWTAVGSSLGLLLWTYARAGGRERALSRWIVAGALVPLAINVGHLLGFGPIEKDFTPLAMAVSSGAFALGLVRYRLLDLRPLARAALADDLREGMLVLDADGRVADVNPALRETLGGDVPLGRPLRDTVPALAEALAAAPEATFRLDSDAGARYVDFRISPLTDRAGSPSGRLVLLHDVTRRRQEQAALRRANADLCDANAELQARNEELDAFAHTVAHDLKNSIQGVMGFAEILRDEGRALTPATHRELAEGIVDTARKMGSVVHELLLLAGVRQTAVEPRPVPMGEVVAEALGRVAQAHDVAAGAHGAVAGVPWPAVLGHAPWVEEVWVNYLSNAAKYGGPTVTVGAEAVGAEAVASGQARFWVHDDGAGIPCEAQERLFVPFSRVGVLDVEGHGLGLSIVHRIAERLGGACGVESAPGAGTRFWFTLPLVPGPGGPEGPWTAVAWSRPGPSAAGPPRPEDWASIAWLASPLAGQSASAA